MKSENYPEEEVDGMEVSNLSDIEFGVMMIRTLNSMKKKTQKP